MTFDPTRPVRTARDGRLARIICTNRKHYDGCSIVALVSSSPQDEYVITTTAQGKGGAEDLVNVPKTKWINIFPGQGYDTREAADYSSSGHRIACIEVTEGEGL